MPLPGDPAHARPELRQRLQVRHDGGLELREEGSVQGAGPRVHSPRLQHAAAGPVPRPCEAHTGPSGGVGGACRHPRPETGWERPAAHSLREGLSPTGRPTPPAAPRRPCWPHTCSPCCPSNPQQTGTAMERKATGQASRAGGSELGKQGSWGNVFRRRHCNSPLAQKLTNTKAGEGAGPPCHPPLWAPWHWAEGCDPAGELGSRVSGTSLHPPGRRSGRPRAGRVEAFAAEPGPGQDHPAPGTVGAELPARLPKRLGVQVSCELQTAWTAQHPGARRLTQPRPGASEGPPPRGLTVPSILCKARRGAVPRSFSVGRNV